MADINYKDLICPKCGKDLVEKSKGTGGKDESLL